MQAQSIKSIKKLGIRNTLDFEVDHPDHNFYAEGVIVSNSHAASYAYNTATTAYFKANHTKEFFVSLLKFPPENGEKEEKFIPTIKQELDFFGIKLLPPSLLKGGQEFQIENNNIRFGLNSIKGIAEAALIKLNNFKPVDCNKFQMFQAAKQAGLGCGVMSALIMSGALDEFLDGITRSKLSFECLLFSKLKDKEKSYVINQGGKDNWDLIELCKNILNWTDGQGKKVARATRLNTLRKGVKKYAEIYKNNRDNEKLAAYWWEKQLLGYSYSYKLRDIFEEIGGRDDLLTLSEIKNLEGNESGTCVCFVNEAIKYISKKGNATMKLFLNDDSDSGFFYFSGRSYQEFCENNPNFELEEGDIVAARIQKSRDGDSGFVQQLVRQDCQIYTKLSEIKDDLETEPEEEKIIEEAAPPINNQENLPGFS